jgi:orotate phosphoribosyltransferase
MAPTAQAVAEALRAEGADVVGVVTVIDREEGAGGALAAPASR